MRYVGQDINGECDKQPDNCRREDPSDCISLCKSVEGCTHFGWTTPENDWEEGRKRCWLKKGNPAPEKRENVISAALANCEGTQNVSLI